MTIPSGSYIDNYFWYYTFVKKSIKGIKVKQTMRPSDYLNISNSNNILLIIHG